MKGFFRQTQLLMDRGELRVLEQDYQRVQAFRYRLNRALGTTSIDIDNLEVVFNAIEMAETLGEVGGFEFEETKDLREALVRIIVGTLEHSQQFRAIQTMRMVPPKSNESKGVGPIPHLEPDPPYFDGIDGYSEIVGFADTLRTKHSPHSISYITFNYDLGLEIALIHARREVDYALEGDPTPSGADVVLKLHGSVNWFADSKHGRIIAVPWKPTLPANLEFVDSQARFVCPSSASLVEEARRLRAESTPWIVPPTESKREYRNRMQSIWRRAAVKIRSADAIVVIGYSLPATDQFFRQFFALACVHDDVYRTRLLEGVWIINPDARAGTRFQRLLGPYVRKRSLVLANRLNFGLDHLKQHVINRTGGHLWCSPQEEMDAVKRLQRAIY